MKRAQGDPRRICLHCGVKGARTIVAGGYAHARCIPGYKPERRKKFDPKAHAQMCADQITRRQRQILRAMADNDLPIRVTRSGAWLGESRLTDQTLRVLTRAMLLTLKVTGIGLRVWGISDIGRLTLKVTASGPSR